MRVEALGEPDGVVDGLGGLTGESDRKIRMNAESRAFRIAGETDGRKL